MPRSFISRIARDRLVTATTGTVSAAPQAALATVALTPTARSLGTITACAPNASALRRQAPRLCGSVTPSSTSNNSGASAVSRTSSSVTCGSASSTTATTPWCWPWPASASRRAPSTGRTFTFARFGARDEVAQPRVLPPGEHIKLVHGIGALAQARGDRVEAEQGASGGHRKVIATGGSAATEAANRCGSVTRATLVPTRQNHDAPDARRRPAATGQGHPSRGRRHPADRQSGRQRADVPGDDPRRRQQDPRHACRPGRDQFVRAAVWVRSSSATSSFACSACPCRSCSSPAASCSARWAGGC